MMRDIEDVTCAWMAEVLGTSPEARLEKIGIGDGQVARCFRVTLRGDDSQESYIVKIPSADEVSRSTATAQRLYVRETSFYKELADRVATRTPICYYVDHNEHDEFLLILEDLSPASSVDQFAGLSIEQAREGLRQLAHLHSATLNDHELHRAEWLAGYALDVQPIVRNVLSGLFDQFLERYDEVIDDEVRQTVIQLRELLPAYSDYQTPHPAVQHGDFRTDNLLFDARDGQIPLAVVDWQTVAVGSPLLDVAYFLVTSLSADDCAAHEDDLLAFYLERMSDLGTAVDAEVARREFARYTLQPIVMLVAASVIVARTERGDRMFLSMIRRGVTATARWGGLKELGLRVTS